MLRLWHLFFLLSTLTFLYQSNAVDTHRDEPQKKYPYGLIGDDHGILNLSDLAANARVSVPRPFSESSNSYPYWQCYSVQKAKFQCLDLGYNKSKKSRRALMIIDINGANKGAYGRDYEYVSRQDIHWDQCNKHQKDWEVLTKQEKFVCISGTFIEFDNADIFVKKGLLVKTEFWIFDKLKTRKGYMLEQTK